MQLVYLILLLLLSIFSFSPVLSGDLISYQSDKNKKIKIEKDHLNDLPTELISLIVQKLPHRTNQEELNTIFT